MDHKTMNPGGGSVMDDNMTNPLNSTMNGRMDNSGSTGTMNGTTTNNMNDTTMNGSKVAKNGGGLAQGVLWLGATALAIVGAKYAWQRAQQSLKNTSLDPKYIETAENMVNSVVGNTLRH